MRTRWLSAWGVVLVTAGLLEAADPLPPNGQIDECHRYPEPAVTPIAPTRGVFIEGPMPPPEDWLCHSNPEVCGPICDFWFGAEFLAWRLKTSDLPTLLISTPAGLIGPSQFAPFEPGTRVLVGGDSLGEESFYGGRFTAGMWLDYEQHYGLEGNYFFLAERSHDFFAESPGGEVGEVLARPFFNVTTELEDARTVPFAGFVDGTTRISAATGFQGGEVNFLCNLGCGGPCAWRIDWLAGIRYLQLTDELLVRETAVDPLDGAAYTVHDSFDCRTHFIGGQLGMRGEYYWGRWLARGHAKVALGLSHYDVRIHGSTVSVSADGLTTTTEAGGLLALSSNIGDHDDDAFAVVPEVGVQVGFRVCEYCTLTVGYNFLYWSHVARAGDQVDLNINPSLVPVGLPPGVDPTQRPAFTLRDTGFWVHGLSVGLQVQY